MTDARSLTRALSGDWHGNYGLVPDIGHGPKDRGLKLWDRPDTADGVGVHSFHGYDFRDVKDALRRQGVLPDRTNVREADGIDAEQRCLTCAREEAKDWRRRIACARTIWEQTQPAQGTPVETYLAEARGINAAIPPSVRFHPSLKCGQHGRFPAMVAGVQDRDGHFVAIQREFLAPDGRGKAPVGTDAKKALGLLSGGAVRLGLAHDVVVLTEGVVTGLAYRAITGAPVWAALSTSGLTSIVLPEAIGRVIIAADRDDNLAGEKAARKLAARLQREGRRVEVILPPEGYGDFADITAAKEAAA